MGAGKILREYLSLPADSILPLSIAHGVDMNHCATAMDAHGVEPLHWSYNETIHRRASAIKKSVLMPHPWLMLLERRPRTPHGSGTLVIGPPPGSSNDRALLKSLAARGVTDFDVLVKQRGQASESPAFWARNGIRTTTAAAQDAGFYERLFSILDTYETIVGCTLSSALFFGASLGKKCLVLTDYFYSAYETPDYLAQTDFTSPTARRFVRLLKQENHGEAGRLAKQVLGADLQGDPSALRASLLQAIGDLCHPIHHQGSNVGLVRRAAELVALRTGKMSLITHGPAHVLLRHMRNRVCVIRLNEIDMWLHGVSPVNFDVQHVRYVSQATEPGWAVD